MENSLHDRRDDRKSHLKDEAASGVAAVNLPWVLTLLSVKKNISIEVTHIAILHVRRDQPAEHEFLFCSVLFFYISLSNFRNRATVCRLPIDELLSFRCQIDRLENAASKQKSERVCSASNMATDD